VTVRKEPLTVHPPVSLLVVVERDPVAHSPPCLFGRMGMLRRPVSILLPPVSLLGRHFHTCGNIKNVTFMRESGGCTWGYGPRCVHPFHCWSLRKWWISQVGINRV